MEKIYRILLGIFLVCLIPILLVLSYWSCRYSYYGTVEKSPDKRQYLETFCYFPADICPCL